jgi:argininosuccinate lyase
LVGVLTMLKGLPLSYNRDLQEDKEALFDAVDTTLQSVTLLTELMRRVRINRDALAQAASGGAMLATELADYLVLKGVPFREAHSIAARVVRFSLERNRDLQRMTVEELQGFSKRFDHDVLDRLTISAAVDRKAQVGGTSKKRVEARIRELERALS